MARAPHGVARGLTLALLLAGSLLAACSDEGPETTRSTTTTTAPDDVPPAADELGPFPVLAGSTTIDGDLASGIPIAMGSTLLGPTFPDLKADGEADGGFVALLLVTGDPVAVYNDYVDSAEALGMGSGQGGCISGFGSITCARRVVDPSDGEALSITVERRPVEDGFVSHAALHYEPPGSVDLDEVGPITPSPPTSAPPVVELPQEVPEADDGWSQLLSAGGPPLELAEGTMLAGPPGPCPCGTRGWSVVLRVDGSTEDAIDAYAAQLGVDDPVVRTNGDADSDSDSDGAMVADLGLVPGGVTQLRVTTDERGTWLLLSVSFG